MKLPADLYYCVYFRMLEEPAMVKPHSYSSEFVHICQHSLHSIGNTSFKEKTWEQAVHADLFMSMLYTRDF